MVKRADEMREEVRPRMRGGEGEVKIYHLFEPGEYRGHARLIARIVLEPGCSIGPHEHQEEEELFYVLRGKARLTEDGTDYELGPHEAALTGGGRSHALANIGDEPLEVLAVILTY
ncbi:MAG: cupin domain-containing protein [Bacillota bacterium]